MVSSQGVHVARKDVEMICQLKQRRFQLLPLTETLATLTVRS